jgi:LmbE family N-acetylglucosaminyl deacetylase
MKAAISDGVRSHVKRLARRTIFQAAERGWELGFQLAGWLLRPSIERQMPSGSDCVLVVAPHPDDETLGCGGAIARHAEEGDRVCVFVVTDGSNSRAYGLKPAEMRRMRGMEAVRAVRALGPMDLVQLGLPEARWDPDDLQQPLEALLRHDQPTLIYAPSCIDFHPEHVKVAQVLARTLVCLPDTARPKVRVYELQVPLTPALADVAVEVGGLAAAKKARAFAEYRTQQGSLMRAVRHSRYLRRLYGSPGPLEVFWDLDTPGYCRLMEDGVQVPRRYRGMRPRPFTDGLAWLVGLRERRQLRKLVRG